MKFTIEKAVLLKTLGHVQNILERRNTVPVLSNVRIEADSNGLPAMTDKNRCINCQHCFCVCPKGAITFDGKFPENSISTDYYDILSLIKSRRSVRKYKNENSGDNRTGNH